MPDFYSIYFTFLSAVFGLVLGSFGNAWAWRICNGEKIQKGRSHCPKCGHVLGVFDLFPLFSWIFLRGKCRYCREKISVRYPLSEAVLGTVFVLLFLKFGLSLNFLREALLFFFLFVASLVDIESMVLPNGLLIAAAVPALLRLPDWKGILIGGVSVSVPLLLLVLVFDKIIGKESMGGGDIKLVSVIGFHLGFGKTFLGLIFACVFGLVFALATGRKKGAAFPFGPFLVLGGFLASLAGDALIASYLSLF